MIGHARPWQLPNGCGGLRFPLSESRTTHYMIENNKKGKTLSGRPTISEFNRKRFSKPCYLYNGGLSNGEPAVPSLSLSK